MHMRKTKLSRCTPRRCAAAQGTVTAIRFNPTVIIIRKEWNTAQQGMAELSDMGIAPMSVTNIRAQLFGQRLCRHTERVFSNPITALDDRSLDIIAPETLIFNHLSQLHRTGQG